LRAHGFSSPTELPLTDGRRADIAAVNSEGEVTIVEIKSSPADADPYGAEILREADLAHAARERPRASAGVRSGRRRRRCRIGDATHILHEHRRGARCGHAPSATGCDGSVY
jgi:hypothetical protein